MSSGTAYEQFKKRLDEAYDLLDSVKCELGYRKNKEFLFLLVAFNEKLIDRERVVSEASVLLDCNKELIRRFNRFLPEQNKISLHESAVKFTHKLRQELDRERYISFLEIMESYTQERKSQEEVADEVSILLNDKPDLLQEFNTWAPLIEDDVVLHLLALAQRTKD